MAHRIAAAVYDGLRAFEYSIAREILGRSRGPELGVEWYEFLACGVEPGPIRTSHGFGVEPEAGLEALGEADTILIAGWREPLDERPPEPFLDALRAAHRRKARLVSICTGIFPLAHAGLLEGRKATTHWLHLDALERSFPSIEIEPNALYVHDDGDACRISTSAGCAAGLDLCLAIVREDYGASVANTIARRMVAPVHRDGGQSQYVEPDPSVSEDERFAPVLDWMVRHLDEPLAVETCARQFGYSLRTFQRRFKALVDLSPHRWLLHQRVAKARELLETSDESVESVAEKSGLGSAANLRKHLAQQLGTTPRAYRSAFRASR